MRLLFRTMVFVAVFAGVGVLTAKTVVAHAAAGGAMQPEVRLAAAMAGLFSGGAAAVLALIAMLWKRRQG